MRVLLFCVSVFASSSYYNFPPDVKKCLKCPYGWIQQVSLIPATLVNTYIPVRSVPVILSSCSLASPPEFMVCYRIHGPKPPVCGAGVSPQVTCHPNASCTSVFSFNPNKLNCICNHGFKGNGVICEVDGSAPTAPGPAPTTQAPITATQTHYPSTAIPSDAAPTKTNPIVSVTVPSKGSVSKEEGSLSSGLAAAMLSTVIVAVLAWCCILCCLCHRKHRRQELNASGSTATSSLSQYLKSSWKKKPTEASKESAESNVTVQVSGINGKPIGAASEMTAQPGASVGANKPAAPRMGASVRSKGASSASKPVAASLMSGQSSTAPHNNSKQHKSVASTALGASMAVRPVKTSEADLAKQESRYPSEGQTRRNSLANPSEGRVRSNSVANATEVGQTRRNSLANPSEGITRRASLVNPSEGARRTSLANASDWPSAPVRSSISKPHATRSSTTHWQATSAHGKSIRSRVSGVPHRRVKRESVRR